MKKYEELHALIQSMSKSEKRYFKVFCRRAATASNYERLFDAIEAQAVYDEGEIKKRFHGDPFVRQLHVTKNYTFQLVLKSLRNFHARVSKDAELKDILRNVEILYNKELYPLCQRELKRADRLAKVYELEAGRVEVATWKRRIAQSLDPQDYTAFESAIEEQATAIANLGQTNAFWKLAIDVSSRGFDGSLNRRDVALLNEAEKAQTIETKVLFYNANYVRYLQENESEKAESALRVLIETLEGYPERLRQDPAPYVSTVNNLVSYYLFNKQYAKALSLIQKAKNAYENWRITSERHSLLKQILRTYNIELEIYRDRRDFDEKVEFLVRTESFIEANVQKMPRAYLLSFWFQLASIHFMRHDFSQSLKWINKLLNARFRSQRTDLEVHARMLNLMIHFEQQNLMVLRYYVDSARRFLRKVRDSQTYKRILLRFFVHVGRLPKNEQIHAFQALRSELFPAQGPSVIPEEDLRYVDYRTWIDAKALGFLNDVFQPMSDPP